MQLVFAGLLLVAAAALAKSKDRHREKEDKKVGSVTEREEQRAAKQSRQG